MEAYSKQLKPVQKLKRAVWNLYAEECHPSPYLLLILLYISCLQTINLYNYSFAVLLCSFIFFTILRKSYFFYYGAAINKLGFTWVTTVNMIMGLALCNEKWKFYVYIFALGDFIEENGEIFKLIMSLVICIEIILNSSFKRQNNIIYFTFFACLACLLCFKKLFGYIEVNQLYAIIMLPFQIKFFNGIFYLFQQKLMKKTKQQIHSPQKAYYYIWLFSNRIKKPQHRYYLIEQHQRLCFNPACFCYQKQSFLATQDKLFEEYTYIEFLKGHEDRRGQWQYLYNKFIQFEIQDKNYFRAILLNTSLLPNPANIFRKVQRHRNKQLIKRILQTNEAMMFESQINQQGIEYDTHYSNVNKKIVSILQKKIQFFIEISKPSSKLKILSETGRAIVAQMQSLHAYFQKILTIQDKINSFSILILYITYLSSTTNFREQVEFRLKNAQRRVRQIRLAQSSKKQIQTALLGFKAQNTNKLKKDTYSTQFQWPYQLVFKNASKSFCQLVSINPYVIPGKSINILIPTIFQTQHQLYIKQVLSDCNQKESKLKGANSQIPILINKEKGIIVNMIIKIIINSKSHIQFVSLITPAAKDKNTIITNFECKNYFSTINIDSNMLENLAIKYLVSSKKQQWEEMTKIQQQKLIILHQSTRYLIRVFCPNQIKYEGFPLIYIQFQQQTGQKIALSHKGIGNAQSCINQLMIHAHRDDQSTQSTSQSKKTAYTTIISNFIENKVMKFFYRFLILLGVIFMLLILFSILTFTAYSSDNAEKTEKIIKDFETAVSIQEIINRRLLLINNLRWAKKGFINTTFIQKVYGKDDINTYISSRLEKSYIALQATINIKMKGDFDSEIGKITQSILNKDLALSLNNQQIYVTSSGLLINCILDFYLIAKSRVDPLDNKSIVVLNYYLHDLRPKLIEIRQLIQTYFNQKMKTKNIGNSVMLAIFFILSILFTIPIYLFKRKYSKYRLNIYDLIVSVETKFLKDEMENMIKLLQIIQPSIKQDSLINKTKINMITSTKFEDITMNQRVVTEQSDNSYSDLVRSQKYQIQHLNNELRKRAGQIDLAGSDQQPCKIAHKKCLIIFFILLIIPLLSSSIGIKIAFEGFLYQKISIINTQHYLYRVAEDSTTIFTQIFQKKLQNVKLSEVDKNSNFQEALDAVAQFSKLKESIKIDNIKYLCNSIFQDQLVCQTPFYQSSLMTTFLILINQVSNKMLSQDQQSIKSSAAILFYLQTVLRELQNILISKSNTQKFEIKQLIRREYFMLIVLFILQILCCLFIGVYGIYDFMISKKQQVQEITIISLFNLQTINSNKRIQSYLEKMSKS